MEGEYHIPLNIPSTSYSWTLLFSLHTCSSQLGSNKMPDRVKQRSPAWLYTTSRRAQVFLPSQQFPLDLLERGSQFRGANSSWPRSWFPPALSCLFTLRGYDCLYSKVWWERRPVLALCPKAPTHFLSLLKFYFCSSALYRHNLFVSMSASLCWAPCEASPSPDQYISTGFLEIIRCQLLNFV